MKADDISGLLKPLPAAGLLEKIGAIAAGEGMRTAVVGGFVRDLLLGRRSQDIDIVVEGDAVRLARRLAANAGGRVVQTSRFGTAAAVLGNRQIDFAAARVERYSRPGALPAVNPGTLEQDLARRDFSVNAIAAELGPDRFGRIVDTMGGRRDLGYKRLRILHPASFSDDPTRLLRGLRFCHRLGFSFEHETSRLFGEAVAGRLWLTLSAARLGRELRLIFAEPDWPDLLGSMADSGLFAPLFGVGLDAGKRSAFARLDAVREYFATHGLKVQAAAVAALVIGGEGSVRLLAGLPGKRGADRPEAAAEKARLACALLAAKNLRPHEIFAVLSGFAPAELAYLWIMCQNEEVTARIRLYTETLRLIKPLLGGGRIAAIAGKGPQVKTIRQQLLCAKLDGELPTLSEETAFVTDKAAGGAKKEDT